MSRAAERAFSTHTTAGPEPRPAFDGYSIDWRGYSEASRAGHGAAFIDQVEATSTRSVVGTVEGAGKERFGFVRGIARNKARTLVAAVGLTSVGVGMASNYDGPYDSAPAAFTQSISQNEPVGPSVDVSTTLAKQVETPKAAEVVAPAVFNLALQAEQAPVITRSSQLTDEQANLVLDMADGRADGITEAVVSVKNGNGGYDTRDWALARTIDKVIDKNADPGALFKPEDPSINGALRWADFTTVAKSADGADYAKGGTIHDGDKLQVDTQSLVATFKATDFKLAPEVITGLSISPKTNLTEAQINAELGSLGIVSGALEKVAPVTVFTPAITTEGAITRLQSGAQDNKTGTEAGTQNGSVDAGKSTETEYLRSRSDKFTLLGVESSNDGTSQIRIVPDSNTDQALVLRVSQQDAKILAEDQVSNEQKGNVVKIDAFEANNRINYVYRRAGNEIRLYSQDTPARAAALKAEIDAKRAEEESFWAYYQTLILFGVITAAVGLGLMTSKSKRVLGSILVIGAVGVPGAIAAVETQSLSSYPVDGALALIVAALTIAAFKSKGERTAAVGAGADPSSRTVITGLTETA